MKKCLIALFLLFSTVVLAKTWEANLRSCDGYGGFWFPNHNWIDKGEPWIKPFVNGAYLGDYKEFGISFNYETHGKRESCYYTVENIFGMEWTPFSSDKMTQSKDSVFFFMANCRMDSTYVCERNMSLENFSINDFALNDLEKYNLGNNQFFYLNEFYSRLTGLYFIYKKNSDKFEYNALCNMVTQKLGCDESFAIQCEFQDDGTLNFDKIPDAKMVPEDFCSTLSIPSVRLNHLNQKNDGANVPLYKVNGSLASDGSSNTVIQNKKQPRLQLKGKH